MFRSLNSSVAFAMALLLAAAASARDLPDWREMDKALDAFEYKRAVPLTSDHPDAMIGQIQQIAMVGDELWVVDMVVAKAVMRFDQRGRFLGLLGGRGLGPGEYRSPFRVAVGPGGRVYLHDFATAALSVYEPDLHFQRQIPVFQGSRWYFPSGILARGDRLFVPCFSDVAADTNLLEIDESGAVIASARDCAEPLKKHHVWMTPVTLIGNAVWLAAQMKPEIFIFDSLRRKARVLEVKGVPEAIDPEAFDFGKDRYGDHDLQHGFPPRVNRITEIIPVGGHHVLVGGFYRFTMFAPPPGQEPDFRPYFHVYDRDGTLLRRGLPLVPPMAPGEEPVQLGGYSAQNLFLYRWRDDSDENPIVYVYEPRSAS